MKGECFLYEGRVLEKMVFKDQRSGLSHQGGLIRVSLCRWSLSSGWSFIWSSIVAALLLLSLLTWLWCMHKLLHILWNSTAASFIYLFLWPHFINLFWLFSYSFLWPHFINLFWLFSYSLCLVICFFFTSLCGSSANSWVQLSQWWICMTCLSMSNKIVLKWSMVWSSFIHLRNRTAHVE